MLPIGKIIDNNFEVLKYLGAGAVGSVYKVKDLKLQVDRALKILLEMLAQNPTTVKRFLRGAQVMAVLDHDGIVKVHSFHDSIYGPYFIMDFVDGENLSDYLKRKNTLKWQEALAIMKKILDVMDYAHKINVIHRDLKPSNIMLIFNKEKELKIKVFDFDLAKLLDGKELTSTNSNFTAGTLPYMSREQIQDFKTADQRSDIYSLGIILYEMVAGKTPFWSMNTEQVILAKKDGNIRLPTKYNYNIPIELEQIILKAVHVFPEHRYQHVEEMLKDIEDFENSQKEHAANIKKNRWPRYIVYVSISLIIFFLLFQVFMMINGKKPDNDVIPNNQKEQIVFTQLISLTSALENNTLIPGNVLIQIGVTTDTAYLNQIKTRLDSLQTDEPDSMKTRIFINKYQVDLPGSSLIGDSNPVNYTAIYLGPVPPNLSNDDIIKRHKIDRLNLGSNRLLRVKIRDDKKKPQLNFNGEITY